MLLLINSFKFTAQLAKSVKDKFLKKHLLQIYLSAESQQVNITASKT